MSIPFSVLQCLAVCSFAVADELEGAQIGCWRQHKLTALATAVLWLPPRMKAAQHNSNLNLQTVAAQQGYHAIHSSRCCMTLTAEALFRQLSSHHTVDRHDCDFYTQPHLWQQQLPQPSPSGLPLRSTALSSSHEIKFNELNEHV